MTYSLLTALTTSGAAAGEIEAEIRKLQIKRAKPLDRNQDRNKERKRKKAQDDADSKVRARSEQAKLSGIMAKGESNLNKYLNY